MIDKLKQALIAIEDGTAELNGNETELDAAMSIAWQLVEMVEGD